MSKFLYLYIFFRNISRTVRSKFIGFLFPHCKNVFFGKIGGIHGVNHIHIGVGTSIQDFFYLTVWPEHATCQAPTLTIGKNCSFGAYNHITCCNRIIIEDNFLSGKWVTITDNSHGRSELDDMSLSPSKRKMYSKGTVYIERNVWVGDKCTILPGIRIGEGAIVAANSVVTKDVPSYTIVAGNPAKVIKQIKE